MTADDLLEAFDDLLFDLRHHPPQEPEKQAGWEATIQRVAFAREKFAELIHHENPTRP